MLQELSLAIDDPEFGPKIRESRIHTPEERTTEARLERLRAKMEERDALNESGHGKKNAARLKLAEDKAGLLLDLEMEWLSAEERFLNGEWKDTEDFMVHDEALQICQFLVKTFRRDLAGFRIAVVTAKKIAPVLGRNRLGTATKLPGKMRYLANFDALVTIDFVRWCMLTDRDRQRLIHHELMHLERGEKQGTLSMRTHDFEDFSNIIDLYGLRSESQIFSTDGEAANALVRGAAQLELLNV